MPQNQCSKRDALTEEVDRAFKAACEARVNLLSARERRTALAPYMDALRFADTQEHRAILALAEHDIQHRCQSANQQVLVGGIT
jgi:hypothetical protein